jgi:thiol:disulfide interchange protein DsbD
MKRFFWAALFLAAALAASGQGPGQEAVVSVKVIPPAEPLKLGQTHVLTLELTIRPPFHINSDQPTEDFLIGTTVDFKPVAGVGYDKVKFPPAEVRKLALAENPLSIYEGQVRVTAEVTLSPAFKGNSLVIEGTVGYQACDDQSCLPPADVSFQKEVKVAGPAAAVPVEARPVPAAPIPSPAVPVDQKGASSHAEVAAKTDAAPPGTAPSGVVPPASAAASSPFEGKGLPLIFGLVFLGGMALNLTPCIYPIIPITVSYFGGQSGGKKGSLVLHAVLYVLGMAVTYSVLGSIAAFTGGLFGAALQLPAVLVFIALVMVILSLSMFDVYELRMPAFLNKFAGGSQKGFFGTLFMGMTVGIIAAPCIGPFVLGLLTYVGNRANVVLGFSLFFVLALGLGLPFLFLGVFSGSLQKLPRSGAWMVWVRKIFGFILIAMALYFLKTLLPNTLVYHLALALTMLVGGVYMAWIEPTKSPAKAFPYIRTAVGIVFFLVALIVASSGVQAYLDEAVGTRLEGLSASGGLVPADRIAWLPYTEDRLDAARSEGKPVFIDSYADWCIPCKELDKLTFSTPEVVAASRSFVCLKADLTDGKDEAVKAFYKKFNVRGVPTLIFLAPDGTEVAEVRTTGFEKKDVFLPKMLKVLELSGKGK